MNKYMTISELISRLQQVKDKEGDIPVLFKDYQDNYTNQVGIWLEEHTKYIPQRFDMEAFIQIKLF